MDVDGSHVSFDCRVELSGAGHQCQISMAPIVQESVLVDDQEGWRLCHNRRHLEEYGLTDHWLTPMLTSADDTLLASRREGDWWAGTTKGVLTGEKEDNSTNRDECEKL